MGFASFCAEVEKLFTFWEPGYLPQNFYKISKELDQYHFCLYIFIYIEFKQRVQTYKQSVEDDSYMLRNVITH